MKTSNSVSQSSIVLEHVQRLNNFGFTVLKNHSNISARIKNDMLMLLASICKNTEFEFNPKDNDLHSISKVIGEKDRGLICNYYDSARSILSTYEVASDQLINSIAKKYMNTDNLLLQINDQIMRIDLPAESQTYLGETNDVEVSMLLPWHQDYPYNQGSKRSLTIYVPLQDGDENNGGTLEVASKSHLEGLINHTYVKDQVRLAEKNIEGISYRVSDNQISRFNTEKLYLDFSDILIFDMDLIHRSVPNNSGNTRFNLQVRLSDINDHAFCKRYPTIKSKRHFNLDKREQELITGI
ncbi:hypothetical protein CL656_05000 [bacterium]|nr:hypothetical protein [bacterium]|tara:strand:+ start:1317 stop:2207 length:891 start_codon:yes stop_codon:yes gene_type:complete